jgi:hypothetical protein
MTGRVLPCGSSGARADIEAHWRFPARLRETKPGSAKYRGPCPKDGRHGGLHVEAGRNGGVVWNTPDCTHGREAAYPALALLVPCAPRPVPQCNPELEALKTVMTAILTNKSFTPTARRLAGLQALGIDQDDALDMLGIIASSNRRRARKERDAAMAQPAVTIRTDSKRRPEAPGKRIGVPSVSAPGPPAEIRLPAATIQPDAPAAINSDNRPSAAEIPLSSTFPGLTDRANVVSGPAGWIRDTNTALDLDLELLRIELGAQLIAREPKRSPFPVADTAEMWTTVEAGPCVHCGATTCLYLDRGSPLCPDCRTPAAVRRAGGAAPVTTSAVQ